ncbi:MAG: hypothetical protein DIU83_00255 [Bacillota bacterium]|nr:MAG: hypothetical protein DIU83_00255 [Bacillota bacterium]
MDEALKEKAKALAQAVKESDVFRAWQQARAELEQRAAAQIMLRDLQRAQAEIMRKVQAGQPVGPEEEERYRRTLETVAYNPYVAAVLQAEQALGQLLAEVNEVIAEELGLGEAEGEGTDGGSGGSAGGGGRGPGEGSGEGDEPRSRLWVPGRP